MADVAFFIILVHQDVPNGDTTPRGLLLRITLSELNVSLLFLSFFSVCRSN